MKNNFHSFHTKIITIKWNQYCLYFIEKKIILSDKDKKILCSLSDKKKKEFIVIRYILNYIGIKNEIVYNKNGCPILSKNKKKYISISHSYDRIAIALSNYKVGIDIEKKRKNNIIKKIKEKFIRSDESTFIPSLYEEDYLYIIWGIKESLYKLQEGKYYNFLKHYKVYSFCIKKDYIITCCVFGNTNVKNFKAFYRKIVDKNTYYLVYVIDNYK